jgi:capsid assembly protease
MNLPGHLMAAPATVASLFASPQIMALDAQLAAPLMQMQLAGAPAPVAANPGTDGRAYPVMRGVAAIRVRGILTPNNDMLAKYYGWTTYHGLAALAAELATAEDVTAIAMQVDSPGGMILGIEAAAEALRALNAIKPVHALVSPMAASAAYWLASQAREIVVTPGGIVGSIGVAVEASSYTGPSMLFGEQYYSLTSSHARAKWPDPATDTGRAEFTRMLDESEARFHAAVSAGRGIPLDQLTTRLSVTADPRDGGAVFYGQDGVTRGLADRVETQGAFFDRLFATYGKAQVQNGSRAALALAAAARARATI